MIGQDHSYAEPEAIRLLRALVDGDERHYLQALTDARRSLRQVERQTDTRPTGRQLSSVTPEQLRIIAQRAPYQTQTKIARDLGIKLANVQHHLKPSKAMRAACASAPEATS